MVKIKETRNTERTFELTLNYLEVKALQTVCRKIAGSPDGPRGVFEKLYEALKVNDDGKVTVGLRSSICFPDTWEEFEEKLGPNIYE